MPQSCPWYSGTHSPNATRQRMTHVIAVFSDEWNWPFNPRNLRSKRQRFLNSGETISEFTAIFCDDWKDIVEDQEEIDDYVLPSKLGNDENEDSFAQYWDSSQARNKRQKLEYQSGSLSTLTASSKSPPSPSVNSTTESLPPSATSSESQIYRLDELESEDWSPLGNSEWNLTPRLIDDIEQNILAPGCALSEDLLPYVNPVDLEPTEMNKMDGDLCLALISDQEKNSSTTVTKLDFITKNSNHVLDSWKESPAKQRPDDDGYEVEPEGFEFWNDFMKCFMGTHGDNKGNEC